MALVKCPECGKEVSSNAAACPHCGSPIPKRMVPVTIERGKTIAMAVNCYVYLDGNMVGELKPGHSLNKQLSVGTHYITIGSDVRAFGHSVADTRSESGDQFTIQENSRSVSIVIKTKGSWTGGIGQCVVDTIDVR
ncbi:MAG: zinc-ribbon domain-containing protein [Clostridia bacterium]|nr:zinc-ribbon domain-containing protein [Clostridia bacterium]